VKKSVLIFLFLLGAMSAMGQKITPVPAKKTSVVHLDTYEAIKVVQDASGKSFDKVYKGIFSQDYSTLSSDSAYFYPDQNLVDAFSHVVINQGDTLHIFSDKLHYDGNTKVATLTDHVKMVDKDATLTTNYLTYNTATRYATYTDGGKLVNKDNTLVSKNGYYFAYTRDAYFRYDVVCTTPDAIIKTDTLRYNAKDKITYFYGPTNILGKKDKDTLYTENGDYNTNTEQARFGKRNLYKSGTKSLKGDSLFYDRLKGYGRAVKNVTFIDTEQKITLKGELGEYFKADDKALVTRNAFMVIVTEEKDSTATDSVKKRTTTLDSLNKKPQTNADSATLKKLGLTAVKKPSVDSATIKRLGLTPTPKPKTNTVTPNTVKPTVSAPVTKPKTAPLPVVHIGPPIAATKPKAAPQKKVITPPKNKATITPKPKDEPVVMAIPPLVPPKDHIKRDSIFIGADTLETQILTYKDYKILKQARYEASHIDKSLPHTVMLTKPPKVLTLAEPKMLQDTLSSHPYFFGRPKPKPVAQKRPAELKKMHLDSVRNARIADSLQKVADHGLLDTSRIRVITAHHTAKLFKSDLQAKADSMFYSYSDSTIRMFVNPMIWTQGAQLSGDTINLQMKNKKLDNMDLFPAGFIVYVEKNDSVHFNQVGGKTMHGIFADNKLASMAVGGNAESIYFNRDSATNKVTQMTRTISGSSYAYFKNGEVRKGALISKSETRTDDLPKIKEDDKTLKNFIWKPRDRPKSKQDVLVPYKPPVVEKKPTATKAGPVKGTMPVKSLSDKKDELKSALSPAKADSLRKADSLKKATPVKAKFGPPIIYN